MQLEKPLSIRAALTAASCGLLGITSQSALADITTNGSQADTGLLYYVEHAGRVRVTEATANVTQPQDEGQTVTVIPTVDVITGASPTGATMSDKQQNFTSRDTTQAYTLPLKSFSDRRYAFTAEWKQSLDLLTNMTMGASASKERDYKSLGGSLALTQDINNKLTTVSVAISGNLDRVEPAGGLVPAGLTPISSAYSPTNSNPASPHTVTTASGAIINSGSSSTTSTPVSSNGHTKNKVKFDTLIGISQVINRRTLMQFNYGIGVSHGYLTDPYKIISMIDGSTGETVDYRTELRPNSRLRLTVQWKTALHLRKDVIHFSYRYYADDWGIHSNTVDLHYHYILGQNFYLEPQIRYYNQSAAKFYHHSLVDGTALPDYASADYRLAKMKSTSYGLKFAMKIGKESELNARFTYMKQTGDKHPADAIGVQNTLDLYPGLEAVMAQLGYIFTF